MKTLWTLLAILAWQFVCISAGKGGIKTSNQWHGNKFGTIPHRQANKGGTALNQWHAYKKEFGKSYSSMKEERLRRQVFEQNLKTISDWNELYRQGKVTYKVGLNNLADQTYEERKASKIKPPPAPKGLTTTVFDLSAPPNATHFQLDEYFCLNGTSCLSPISDQKKCASGYAIAALTLLEFGECMRSGAFQSYSLEQVLDCSTNSQGCDGGFSQQVFQYFTQNLIMPKASYKPQNNKASECMYNQSVGIGTLNPAAIVRLASPNYGQPTPVPPRYIASALLQKYGPIAVRFDSGGRKSLFDFYNSGVYDDPNCANLVTNGSNATDHSLVLIGVGTTNTGQKVWIAQNSMGKNWGDNGKVYLPLWQNTCNIGLEPYALTLSANFL